MDTELYGRDTTLYRLWAKLMNTTDISFNYAINLSLHLHSYEEP